MDLWRFGQRQGSLGRHAMATYCHCTFGGHLGWVPLDVLLTPITWLMHRKPLFEVMDDLSVKSITREDLEVRVIRVCFSALGFVSIRVCRYANTGLSNENAHVAV